MHSNEPNKKNSLHWSNNLIRELNDPTKWVLWNNEIVVVADRYPKAKYHLLVMPRANISSIFDVSSVGALFRQRRGSYLKEHQWAIISDSVGKKS